MIKSYDKVSENEDILLDLSFYEGSGIITHNQAHGVRPTLDLNDPGGGSFTWVSLASGLSVLEFAAVGGGAVDGVYLDCSGANTADLNFTVGDYSVGCWIKWDSSGGWSEIIIGRYEVHVTGWEIYLDISGGRNTVSQRHSHVSLVPNLNSNCFSVGWTPGIWAFLGISTIGGALYPKHYRNGNALAMSYQATGMFDPDTSVKDLVIGCRYDKAANWYRGQMWRPRVWNRALSQIEWQEIFNIERHWFGV